MIFRDQNDMRSSKPNSEERVFREIGGPLPQRRPEASDGALDREAMDRAGIPLDKFFFPLRLSLNRAKHPERDFPILDVRAEPRFRAVSQPL